MRPLFANRSFLAVWAASFVSGLGDKIAILAFFSLVYHRTGNVASLGLLAAVQVLPGVLLGPFAGVMVDRWSRRGMMIASDLFSTAVVCAIPFVPELWQVYLLASLLAAGRHLTGPARMALLPDLVPAEQLGHSNALFMISQNAMLLVGMAAGGLIVHALGVVTAFLVDGATFLISAAILAFRPFRYLTVEQQPAGGAVVEKPAEKWHDIRQGAVWLWGRPSLRFAVLFLGLVTMVTAMQPPLVYEFVTRMLGRSEGDLGLIFATAGLGGLLGAAAGVLTRGARRPLRAVGLLVAFDGLLLGLFAVNRSFAGALVLFALFGAVSTGIQINLATFLQRETPPERRGRIFGWLGPLLGPVTLLSVLAGPTLASLWGVGQVLVVASIAEIIFGLAGALRAPFSDEPGRGGHAGADRGRTAPPAAPGAGEAPPALRSHA
ncbi:MAG: hypothetical protein C0395_06700 [Gemmatimonas sp.]|nr:hypothetical protein [Gemmatimonas sp.]